VNVGRGFFVYGGSYGVIDYEYTALIIFGQCFALAANPSGGTMQYERGQRPCGNMPTRGLRQSIGSTGE
jgi:hypothetical protein